MHALPRKHFFMISKYTEKLDSQVLGYIEGVTYSGVRELYSFMIHTLLLLTIAFTSELLERFEKILSKSPIIYWRVTRYEKLNGSIFSQTPHFLDSFSRCQVQNLSITQPHTSHIKALMDPGV